MYVIFGASGGIGSALAARLSKQQDASVVCVAESEEAIKQIGDVGGNAEHHVADAQKFDEACTLPVPHLLCYTVTVTHDTVAHAPCAYRHCVLAVSGSWWWRHRLISR